MLYAIGEFAELSGVSIKTLRFYDEIGLLRPAATNPRTHYRHYLPRQLEEIAAIVALKELGVPLSTIRETVKKTNPAEGRRRLLIEVKAALEKSLLEKQRSLAWVEAELERMEFHPVIRKHLPAMRIASLRARLSSYAEVDLLEQELLARLPAAVRGSLRGVLWHRCLEAGSLECEPFVTLKVPVQTDSQLNVRTLPSMVAACAFAQDDEAASIGTFRTMHRWVDAQRQKVQGPTREIYLPGLLEIQFPVEQG